MKKRELAQWVFDWIFKTQPYSRRGEMGKPLRTYLFIGRGSKDERTRAKEFTKNLLEEMGYELTVNFERGSVASGFWARKKDEKMLIRHV